VPLVLPVAAEQLRGDSAERRDAGQRLLTAAAARSAAPAAIAAAVQRLRDVFMGADGPLTAPAQRIAVAEAIGSLRASGVAAPGELAPAAVQALVDMLGRETAADVFAALVSALGAWAAVAKPAPPAALKELVARLKDKDEPKRRAVLDAMSLLVSAGHVDGLTELAKELAAQVKTVAAKPVNPALGLAALRVAAKLAAASPAVDQKLSEEKLWPAVLSASSFVLAAAAAGTENEADGRLHVDVLGLLWQRRGTGIDKCVLLAVPLLQPC
jgi:hypothetical protein